MNKLERSAGAEIALRDSLSNNMIIELMGLVSGRKKYFLCTRRIFGVLCLAVYYMVTSMYW